MAERAESISYGYVVGGQPIANGLTLAERLICSVVECATESAYRRGLLNFTIEFGWRARNYWQDSAERDAWLATMGLRWIPGRARPL